MLRSFAAHSLLLALLYIATALISYFEFTNEAF